MKTLFNIEFHETHQQQLSAFRALQQTHTSPQKQYALFQELVWHYYRHHKRNFAWRTHTTPYNVVVSEMMLQQTQAETVAGKFDPFITQFPNFATLATAPFHDVLLLWKGLGYNRRALALQKIATIVTDEYKGQLPQDPKTLETLPNIGKATAASIVTYAFNTPTTFIETNVRTVFIYFFFDGQTDISDAMLLPHVAATVDQENPRDWYYALMDYGVMLKKTVGNLCRLSKHYTKQSKFEGSDRQIRGMVLQALLDQPGVALDVLPALLAREPARVTKVIAELQTEGFVVTKDQLLWLTK